MTRDSSEVQDPDDSLNETEADRASFEFLLLYAEDRSAGRERTLEEYLKRFAAHAERIASEWGRLQGEAVATEGAPSALTRIAGYEILGELGRGGQGVVYRARDLQLNREVALKVLDLPPFNAEAALARFRREAEVASKLDHPGICGVLDTGVDGGVAWIAMRFVAGRTLREFLREGEQEFDEPSILRLDRAANEGEGRARIEEHSTSESQSSRTRAEVFDLVGLFAEIAEALHAAHQAGVLHRDLKPGNIMVTPEHKAVILDFGLARLEDDGLQTLTRSGEHLGTPAYMSPEQLKGEARNLDVRSDVWSLGVTLYECLTLRRPFSGPTRQALFRAIEDRDPPRARRLCPTLPRDLEIVVVTALQKNPDDRYQDAGAFAEDLRRILESKPIAARPAGPMLHLLRWTQRHPAIALSLIVTFLSLASALVISLRVIRRERLALDGQRAALRAEQRQGYFRQILLADAAIRGSDLEGARRVLAAIDPAERGWEWRYLATRSETALWRSPPLGTRNRFLAFGVEDRTLISVVNTPENGEGGVRIFDAKSGELLRTFGCGGEVTRVALSRERDQLLIAHGARVEVWSLADGEKEFEFEFERPWSFAFHPDGEHLVGFQKQVLILFSLADQRIVRRLDVKPGTWWHEVDPERHAILTIDPRAPLPIILALGGGEVVGHLPSSGQQRWVLSRERSELIRADRKGGVHAFDLKGLRPKWEQPAMAGRMVPGPLGRSWFTARRNRVLRHSIEDGSLMGEILYSSPLDLVGYFSADGRRMAAQHLEGKVAVYPVNGAGAEHLIRATLLSLEDPQRAVMLDWGGVRRVDAKSGRTEACFATRTFFVIRRGALLDRGKRLLLATEADDGLTEIELLDLETGESLVYLREHREVLAVASDPASEWVVVADAEGEVSVRDARSLEILLRWREDAPVRSLSVSDDGRRLVLGTQRGSILIRDARSGALITRKEAHSASVNDLETRGDRLISGGRDGVVRISRLEDLHEIARYPGFDGIDAVSLHPAMNRIAVGTRSGLSVLDTETATVILSRRRGEMRSRETSVPMQEGVSWCRFGPRGERLYVRVRARNGELIRVLELAPPPAPLVEERAINSRAAHIVRDLFRKDARGISPLSAEVRRRAAEMTRVLPDVRERVLGMIDALTPTASTYWNSAYKLGMPKLATPEEIEEACELMEEAIRLDPTKARHHAFLSRFRCFLVDRHSTNGRTGDAIAALDQAARAMMRADELTTVLPKLIAEEWHRLAGTAELLVPALVSSRERDSARLRGRLEGCSPRTLEVLESALEAQGRTRLAGFVRALR